MRGCNWLDPSTFKRLWRRWFKNISVQFNNMPRLYLHRNYDVIFDDNEMMDTVESYVQADCTAYGTVSDFDSVALFIITIHLVEIAVMQN
jgi:hypothetical protein